jgi:hypothetical protein
MKMLTTTLLALFTLVSVSSVASAATSEVTWTDYEKYTDIRSGNESRKHFRERTFYNFEKHFTKLAKKLPEDQVLKINVTNVDLAGDTNAGGIDQLRIVKDIYFPRMNFTYQLLNSDGSEVSAAKVALKNMSFMMGGNLRYRNDSLGYEKYMLDDWFFKTFQEDFIEQE